MLEKFAKTTLTTMFLGLLFVLVGATDAKAQQRNTETTKEVCERNTVEARGSVGVREVRGSVSSESCRTERSEGGNKNDRDRGGNDRDRDSGSRGGRKNN
jgi:hypothetical protein